MLKLLIWILVGYCVYLMIKGRAGKKEMRTDKPAGEDTYCDPVCGTYITENDAVVGRLEGKRIFFCSMSCLEKYQEKVSHK